MRVKVLGHTPQPMNVVYAAARQCYKEGWIADSCIIYNKEIYAILNTTFNLLEKKSKSALIRHLLKSGHHSVFEHVNITFAIDGVSRALTHQLVRHRIASYSQQSQRYVDMRKEHGSDDVTDALSSFVIPPEIQKNDEALSVYMKTLREVVDSYNLLRELGIEAEDARYLYPNAAKSRIVMTINLRSLMNFFSLRLCTRAQWEIRNLAKMMLKECKEIVPEIFSAFGARCKQLGYCPEDKGCGLFPSFQELGKKMIEKTEKKERDDILSEWNIETKDSKIVEDKANVYAKSKVPVGVIENKDIAPQHDEEEAVTHDVSSDEKDTVNLSICDTCEEEFCPPNCSELNRIRIGDGDWFPQDYTRFD